MLYEISEIERQMIADALDIISPDNDEARRTLESLLGTFQLEQPPEPAPSLLDALLGLLDEATFTCAWDDALAGEDEMMLAAVRKAEAAISAATGETVEPAGPRT